METLIISSDSHFVEPPTMWAERVDKEFRDRAPRAVRGLDGKPGDWLVCENIKPMPIAGFFLAGVDPAEFPARYAAGLDEAPGHVWDPKDRLVSQDQDGIAAEVIYPSMAMPLFGLDDAPLQGALFRAFNDWATDYCNEAPKRLVPVGLLALDDIDAAVEEMHRISARGMQSALIWAEPPEDRPYSHPDYDPVWAAAQELDFKLAMHILTGRKGALDYGGNIIVQATVLYQEVVRSLSVFVLDGVLERFPGLKLVSAENDIGWLAHFVWRMDRTHSKLKAVSPNTLTMKPSDYIKRQVFCTFIEDPFANRTVDFLGAGNMMWASDFPHAGSTWPRSQANVEKIFSGMSDEDTYSLIHGTCASLYNLD